MMLLLIFFDAILQNESKTTLIFVLLKLFCCSFFFTYELFWKLSKRQREWRKSTSCELFCWKVLTIYINNVGISHILMTASILEQKSYMPLYPYNQYLIVTIKVQITQTTYICIIVCLLIWFDFFLQVNFNMKSLERFFCTICTVREKDCIILPCGHTFCAPCSYQVKDSQNSKCPVCNGVIEKLQPLYM